MNIMSVLGRFIAFTDVLFTVINMNEIQSVIELLKCTIFIVGVA